MRGNLILIASALVGALLTTSGARAQNTSSTEKWTCTDTNPADQKPALEFVVQQGSLIQQSPGPTRYHLLSNTMHGLVAVDYSTDLELGYLDVFVATVLIDKITGSFIATSSTSGKPPEQHTGLCHGLGTTASTASAQPK